MDEWEEKLRALKLHPDFPFRTSTSDETQYMQLELFWLYLFRSVVGSPHNTAWRSWHEPDRDRTGNPIFSAVSLPLARGTRVLQHPGPDDPDVKTWGYFSFQPYLSHTSPQGLDYQNDILELCIVADVSEESERYCRHFWKLFCVDRLAESAMEVEIGRYERSVHMPSATGERK